jgi:hypothetical protein
MTSFVFMRQYALNFKTFIGVTVGHYVQNRLALIEIFQKTIPTMVDAWRWERIHPNASSVVLCRNATSLRGSIHSDRNM